jgi:hypothetical protein
VIEFHATAAEAYTDENGVLVVHFDDEGDIYLQLQAPEADDPVEFEAGYGNVYVEVNDQINGGFNCFSEAVLGRDHFRIVFARDPAMVAIGEVVVTLDIDDAAFADLRQALARTFRHYPGYRDEA